MKLLVVAVILAAVFVRLGLWQLDRLGERRARNAVIAARLALPPLEVRGPGIAADSVRNRRLVARGVFDFGHERVWRGRSFQGTPGVALVTPLRLADGSAVFVDRGWVPSPDASRVDRSLYREPDSVEVAGLGAVPPRGREDLDLVALADSVPYPLLPFVIQLETPPPPREVGLPRRWPGPQLGNGPHLAYAVQWFSFALIALGGTVALLRRKR